MRQTALILTAALATISASTALACGESLFRVGRGVEFREYSAPLPGRIIVVVRTDAERAMAERLAAAGHDIHPVSDPENISTEIAGSDHEFDLVIAWLSQRDIVEAATASTRIGFLPVALEGEEESRAKDQYEHYLQNDGSVRKFLRSIHAVLRDRTRSSQA